EGVALNRYGDHPPVNSIPLGAFHGQCDAFLRYATLARRGNSTSVTPVRNMTAATTSGQCRWTDDVVAPVSAKYVLLVVLSETAVNASARTTATASTASNLPNFHRVECFITDMWLQ